MIQTKSLHLNVIRGKLKENPDFTSNLSKAFNKTEGELVTSIKSKLQSIWRDFGKSDKQPPAKKRKTNTPNHYSDSE